MGQDNMHHVIIVGGGFGGLYAAKALRGAQAKVSLVDQRNFHLFQPLLYQVATGALAAGDIAFPLREVFKRYKNFYVLSAEVVDIDPDQKRVLLRDGELAYDTLILASGSSHHYFGHEEWSRHAPALKTVENALDMRRRIFLAFEVAERQSDPAQRSAWMTFAVVGGGPTGVELSGSLGELVRNTLRENFRHIDPAQARILLLEGLDRVLPSFPPELSAKAEKTLARLGVTVTLRTQVTRIEDGTVTLRTGNRTEQIQARTVLWCAGVKASPLGQILAERAGVPLDRIGRVMVEPDLTLSRYPDIFVIGDLANFSHQRASPLPGLAAVAMQQGQYAAEIIRQRLHGNKIAKLFQYRDKGNLCVIGRNTAVADLGRFRFNGFLAWLIWIFVHIRYLIGFDNKFLVLFQWGWNYLTQRRRSRLITGEKPFPILNERLEHKTRRSR